MQVNKIIFSALTALSLGIPAPVLPKTAPAFERVASSRSSHRRFAAESAYIRPPLANHIDAQMPTDNSSDQVLGIYGNILYPQDLESIQRKKIYEWIGTGGRLPLSDEEMRDVSNYILDRIPERAFRWYFAHDVETALVNGATMEDALEGARVSAAARIEQYKEMALALSGKEGRHQLLAAKLNECADKGSLITKILSKDLKKKPSNLQHLLRSASAALIESPYDWDTRIDVLKQMVDKTTALSPNSAYFLALQEVTPQALSDMKKKFAERNIQWISVNNLTGKPTKEVREEEVDGESTAFTSTIALSPELKVLKTELGDLPTESGSIRKILGVRVLNTLTNKTFDIFTTHTDHKIQNDIYLRTALKVHEFMTDFRKDAAENQPYVMGGDLNAFPDQGGDQYVEKLRELLPSSRDFRESNYYAPSQIAWSSFIGRGDEHIPIPLGPNGEIEHNGLDQLLVGNVQVSASGREALVYDKEGKLIDPYTQRAEYIENLKKRITFSDHLFNIVRFTTN
ncbi:MAG: hypothetical protein JSS32_05585 [Verrucomicrobia bacterium]|nr:hypothetical protein [Verrucomicrobiota bacterium]